MTPSSPSTRFQCKKRKNDKIEATKHDEKRRNNYTLPGFGLGLVIVQYNRLMRKRKWLRGMDTI